MCVSLRPCLPCPHPWQSELWSWSPVEAAGKLPPEWLLASAPANRGPRTKPVGPRRSVRRLRLTLSGSVWRNWPGPRDKGVACLHRRDGDVAGGPLGPRQHDVRHHHHALLGRSVSAQSPSLQDRAVEIQRVEARGSHPNFILNDYLGCIWDKLSMHPGFSRQR